MCQEEQLPMNETLHSSKAIVLVLWIKNPGTLCWIYMTSHGNGGEAEVVWIDMEVPKLGVPADHPKLDHFSIEIYGFGDPPL